MTFNFWKARGPSPWQSLYVVLSLDKTVVQYGQLDEHQLLLRLRSNLDSRRLAVGKGRAIADGQFNEDYTLTSGDTNLSRKQLEGLSRLARWHHGDLLVYYLVVFSLRVI